MFAAFRLNTNALQTEMHVARNCFIRTWGRGGGWEIDFDIPVVNMDVMKRETRSRRERLHAKR